jgi:hypothetical protein
LGYLCNPVVGSCWEWSWWPPTGENDGDDDGDDVLGCLSKWGVGGFRQVVEWGGHTGLGVRYGGRWRRQAAHAPGVAAAV